jgi:hypothetical protein
LVVGDVYTASRVYLVPHAPKPNQKGHCFRATIKRIQQGLLGLWSINLRRRKCNLAKQHYCCVFPPEPTQPRLCLYPEKKKGEKLFVWFGVYRFLSSISASRSTTTIMATIVPTDIGMKYRSAADAGVGVGSGVAAGASSTVMAVSANEP